MADVFLSANEREIIVVALQMRTNFIETGSVVLSAEDAVAQKKPVKALSTDQMRLIVRSRELVEKLLKVEGF